jgi:hypothetical protein
MGATPLFFTSGLVTTTAVSGATEVVAATLTSVTTRYYGQRVTLNGRVLLTTPGSTVSVVLQVRQGSLTGTQVGDHTAQIIIAPAGSANVYDVTAVDTPGDVAQYNYVLTVTCTSGSGAGNIVYGILEARVD